MAKFQAKPIFHIRFHHFKYLCSSIWPSWKVNLFNKISVELYCEVYFDALTKSNCNTLYYGVSLWFLGCIYKYICLYFLIQYNNKQRFNWKLWTRHFETILWKPVHLMIFLLNLLQSKKAWRLILRQVKSWATSLKHLTKFPLKVGNNRIFCLNISIISN